MKYKVKWIVGSLIDNKIQYVELLRETVVEAETIGSADFTKVLPDILKPIGRFDSTPVPGAIVYEYGSPTNIIVVEEA